MCVSPISRDNPFKIYLSWITRAHAQEKKKKMSDESWLEGKNKYIGVPNSWLVIFVVFILLFTGFGVGFRQRANIPSGQDLIGDLLALEVTDEDWVPSRDEYERSSITIDFEIDQSDWQAGGAATPTGPVYSYFYGEPTEGDTGIGITPAGEDITVRADYDGIIWIDLYGGSDFYVIDTVIRSAIPECKSTKVVDWDGDDNLDLLMQLDLSRFLMEDFQYKPTYVMELPLMDVDVAHAIDSPAAQVVGTAQITKTITWKYTACDAEDGYAISELYVLTNDTAKGVDLTLKALTISGTHTIERGSSTLQPIHTSIGGAYAAYYIQPSDVSEPLDPDNLIIFRDTNMGDEMYFSVQVQCNFEANDDLLVSIYIVVVDPAGTTAVLTDGVELNEQ